MKNDVYYIKDLYKLHTNSHYGLYKKGHAISTLDYNLACDYLQKINYTLQDIRSELVKPLNRSVLICLLTYTTWILEAVDELKKCYKQYVFQSVPFNMELLETNKKYIRALRSFAIAHPLTTNRHLDYQLDGNLRCIDIQVNSPNNRSMDFSRQEQKFYLDIDGLKAYNQQLVHYWLCVYNSKYQENKYFQYIGINIGIICNIVNDYVDYIYMLDKHLSKLKIRKDQNKSTLLRQKSRLETS